jgi:hypothetical protein
MNNPSPTTDLASEWNTARVLYPVYVALAREFVIDLKPCSELEASVEAPEQEAVELARQWFLEMDGRIQVHQLRQFLQTTTLADDEALRLLLVQHLRKPAHSDSDRDKIDFLLVQFFSHCAPSRLEDADVDLAYVSQVLEPVLGSVDPAAPEWIKPLDELISQASHCGSLSELLGSKILDRGRKIKTASGQKYFEPAAMVAFTRFSFLMRRVFFRLMHQDLNAILDGLRELESRGVTTLDCRRAQFSAEEPVARLRMICQSWKVMFHAEYSSGQPLSMLVDLRTVINTALARSAQKKTDGAVASRARTAAAGAGDSGAPEFEVSPQEWKGGTSTEHSNPPGDESAS